MPLERRWLVWTAVHSARAPDLIADLSDEALAARMRTGVFPPSPSRAPILLMTVGLPGVRPVPSWRRAHKMITPAR